MEFEKVIAGIVKYLNKNIFPGLNDWQTVLARSAVARFLRYTDRVKGLLLTSKYLQTFDVIDSHGNVDVDGAIADIKEQMKCLPDGRARIQLPLLGKYTICAADIDELHRIIKEG